MSNKTMSLLLDVIRFVNDSSKAPTPQQKPTPQTKTKHNHQKHPPKPTKQKKEEEDLDSDSSCSTHASMPSLVFDEGDRFYQEVLRLSQNPDWKPDVDELRDALGEN